MFDAYTPPQAVRCSGWWRGTTGSQRGDENRAVSADPANGGASSGNDAGTVRGKGDTMVHRFSPGEMSYACHLLLAASSLIDHGKLLDAARILRVAAGEHLDALEEGVFRELAASVRWHIADVRGLHPTRPALPFSLSRMRSRSASARSISASARISSSGESPSETSAARAMSSRRTTSSN